MPLAVQGAQSRSRGGQFATLNGAAARDVLVMHVPAHTTLPGPVHVLYLSSASSASRTSSSSATACPASAPRLLAVLEEGATAEVVEEFAALHQQEQLPTAAAAAAGAAVVAPAPPPPSFTCAVAEFELDDGAALRHSYVQLEGRGAFHVKATLVTQGRGSRYTLAEARLGGALTRHDLSVEQLGEATHTQVGVGWWLGGSRAGRLESSRAGGLESSAMDDKHFLV